jgi:hypothetical protein
MRPHGVATGPVTGKKQRTGRMQVVSKREGSLLDDGANRTIAEVGDGLSWRLLVN